MSYGAGHSLTCSAVLTVQHGLSLKKEAGGGERGNRPPRPAHSASYPNGASHPLGSTILQESVASLAEQMQFPQKQWLCQISNAPERKRKGKEEKRLINLQKDDT